MTTATVPITAKVVAFPMEDQYRAIDGDLECETCHGALYLLDPLYEPDGKRPCPGCGGDPEAPVYGALSALEGDVQQHARRLGRRIKEIEAEAELLEQHADAIALRAERRRKQVASVKRWLLVVMQGAGIEKVKDEFCTVYLQRNPPSFDVLDERAVPARHKVALLKMPLQKVPVELLEYATGIEVSKASLKEELEADGVVAPGTEYVTTRQHVRIR